MLLCPGGNPVDVVSSFSYLGSILSDDCTSGAEVASHITRASHAFRSLSRMLWYQKKIKSRTKLRIFNSVIMPTLLYALECTVLLEPQVRRLQGFVMRCLRIILRVSLWDKQRNTTMRKLAKQQRVSSILVQRRLCLLGHLVRMNDSRLPKKMLVCAPAGGNRAVGGQKCRWNDLVVRDLRRCGVEEDWRDVALERRAWQCVVREGAVELNEHDENEEVKQKDERRRRRKNRLRHMLLCHVPIQGVCLWHCLRLALSTTAARNTSSLCMPSVCTVARLYFNKAYIIISVFVAVDLYT